jgi:hypothetical protein
VTTFVVRLIAVIVRPAARTVPLDFWRTSTTWLTRRYCVESTVNVVAAAGDVASVARVPVPSPKTWRLIALRIPFASRSVWRSSSLTKAPALLPVACWMSGSLISRLPLW